MSDSEYLTRAEAALAAIERALDDTEADIEFERSGNVLTLEFENRSKIIVNLQPPMREIWIAAKAGGFHFRFIDGAVARYPQRHGVFLRAVGVCDAAGRRAGSLRSVSDRLMPRFNAADAVERGGSFDGRVTNPRSSGRGTDS